MKSSLWAFLEELSKSNAVDFKTEDILCVSCFEQLFKWSSLAAHSDVFQEFQVIHKL